MIHIYVMHKALFTISTLLILLLTSYFSYGVGGESRMQTHQMIDILLKIDRTEEATKTNYLSRFQKDLADFKAKQQKWNNDKKMLNHLFMQIHSSYLKKYIPLQSFNAVLSEGVYGCLTGTIIYALFLEDLGYNYEIIESNYHVVIVVNSNEKRYLLESTDPISGFVSRESEIKSRLQKMEIDNKGKNEEGKYYFKVQINNSITLSNLIGLQLYNFSITAYNNGQYQQAVKLINQAKRYYSSARLEEFSSLVIDHLGQQFAKQ